MVNKIVSTISHSLRDHPIALTLLALNCVFLVATAWTTHEIASNARTREASFHALLKDCIDERNK